MILLLIGLRNFNMQRTFLSEEFKLEDGPKVKSCLQFVSKNIFILLLIAKESPSS